MAARQCFHCKETIESGAPHDCWTTTEAALTGDLNNDLHDAWTRLRESAAELGEQRIYASHNSIMFSRRCCYAFVRPKRTYLELCIFLNRQVHAAPVRRVQPSSRTKFAHLLRITHRDQVEAPVTDWLAEAYELAGQATAASRAKTSRPAAARRAPPTPSTRRLSAGRKP